MPGINTWNQDIAGQSLAYIQETMNGAELCITVNPIQTTPKDGKTFLWMVKAVVRGKSYQELSPVLVWMKEEFTEILIFTNHLLVIQSLINQGSRDLWKYHWIEWHLLWERKITRNHHPLLCDWSKGSCNKVTSADCSFPLLLLLSSPQHFRGP